MVCGKVRNSHRIVFQLNVRSLETLGLLSPCRRNFVVFAQNEEVPCMLEI